MFRANRVGTPQIAQVGQVSNVTSFTVFTQAIATSYNDRGNVINAAPGGEFSYNQLGWLGAARTIPAGHRWILAQQFTVTQPIDGDTVGIEVMGSLLINLSAALPIRPCFGKLDNAPGALLGQLSMGGYAVGLKHDPVADTALGYQRSYRTQALWREDRSTIAGVYVHGFQINNVSAGAVTFSLFDVTLSERQLGYQEAVGYRDTLR